MPKRLVDGDAIAKSKKLKDVPEWMRAEFALLLTLALGNGSFECDAETIWTDLYAFNRPSMTSDKVQEMLSEFERAKMLFRWESDGKIWGHWVGQAKSGRLPAPSEKGRHRLGPEIPPQKLAKFLSPTSRVNREALDTVSRLGIGNGTGSGSGKGGGNGTGVGVGSGGQDKAAASQPPKSTDGSDDRKPTPLATTETETPNKDSDSFKPDPESLKKVKPEEVRFLTLLLRELLKNNAHASEPPAKWKTYWDADFKLMLSKYDFDMIESVVWYSQIPRNQEYFVRTKGILDNIDNLVTQIQEDDNKRLIAVKRKSLSSTRLHTLAGQAKSEAGGIDEEDE